MQQRMDMIKALADESRVRILMALRDQELCVCQLVALLELAPSTVSKHISILRQARLVESRKEGRWIFYRLPDTPSPATSQLLAWLDASMGATSRIQEDICRLEKIIAMDREELCQ